jgi:hypothetical protein
MEVSRQILIEFDKSGAEWVVVAYLTGDARMLDVVEGKKDPHLITGNLITGVPEDLIMQESKIVGQNSDPDTVYDLRQQLPRLYEGEWYLPRTMSIRQMGKKSNHGLNYDMKYKRFALENEVDETEAKRVVELYRTTAYPGIPVWHETVRDQLRKDRTLINCFNRKYIFLDAWGPELFDAAYAFLPQSTVFDITRIGMVKLWNDNSAIMSKVQLLEQTHDSILTQYPVDDLLALARVCGTIGLDYMNPTLYYNSREFHIDTSVKLGFNWGSMIEIPLVPDETAMTLNIKHGLELAYESEAT